MNKQEVRNTSGRLIEVDMDRAKVYDYNNKEGWIEYNAPIIDENEIETFENFRLDGKLEKLEDRLQKWDSRLKLSYALSVGFDQDKNDPDGAIYKRFVEYVSENEGKFFESNGDVRKTYSIDPKSFL